ncbi:MAG: hypothetical protein NVSMB56_15240 [Pyrinomonadaceae bacterium]
MAEDIFSDDELLDEDFSDDEPDVETRTVLLAKNEMLALLGLKTSEAGGMIIRTDPREAVPAAQSYESATEAVRWFKRSLRTSEKNGWIVVYDGVPLRG